MPEKEVISSSSYLVALVGIVGTWWGWIIRKVLIIDREYVTRAELNSSVKELRESIDDVGKGVHNRLDTIMRDQLYHKDDR